MQGLQKVVVSVSCRDVIIVGYPHAGLYLAGTISADQFRDLCLDFMGNIRIGELNIGKG